MMKKVIRLGDPTSHGGTVLSAAPYRVLYDKPVARMGDKVSCPMKGHSNCVIVQGDPAWIVDGQPVALEGHLVSCGAVLISTLKEVDRDYVGGGSSTKAVAAKVSAEGNRPKSGQFDEHFILQDKTTSQALTGFAYGIETEFGEHHDHVYEDGATAKAYSESPSPVKLLYALQTEIGIRK